MSKVFKCTADMCGWFGEEASLSEGKCPVCQNKEGGEIVESKKLSDLELYAVDADKVGTLQDDDQAFGFDDYDTVAVVNINAKDFGGEQNFRAEITCVGAQKAYVFIDEESDEVLTIEEGEARGLDLECIEDGETYRKAKAGEHNDGIERITWENNCWLDIFFSVEVDNEWKSGGYATDLGICDVSGSISEALGRLEEIDFEKLYIEWTDEEE